MIDTVANIPASLKARQQWICWKYVTKDGRVTKPPHSPRTGKISSATDPANWVSFDEALAASQRFDLSGIGIALSPDDNLTGFDLDHCWNNDGLLSDVAKEVLNLAETYAEISPSGKGIRLIGTGKILDAVKDDRLGIEMYGTGRYLTITGQHLDNTPTEIMPAPKTRALLEAAVKEAKASIEQPADSKPASRSSSKCGGDLFSNVNNAALANIGAWVTDLFPTARRSSNGAWRVTSHNLKRDLEEDLSIHPRGIKDWGVHDMGGPRKNPGGRSPIDLVIECGKTLNSPSAARYLCARLGVTPESMGWDEGGEVLKAFLNKTKDVESPPTQPNDDTPKVDWNWEDGGILSDGSEKPQQPAKRSKPKSNNSVITEDSAALRFVAECGDKLRYCHSTGAWFRWDGNLWRQDGTRVAFYWARSLARELSEYEDPKTKIRVEKKSFANGVEGFAQCDPAVAVTIDNWDQDEWLLGTPSGTVDLRTGKLRAAKQEDGITKSTSAAPADTGCPLWLKFLNETTGEDQALIQFLQQWLGYCLTGSIREHAFIFVYGDGGNGKSVFLETVTHILGDYATTAAMDTFTASQNDRHPTDLAMLRGARIVTASETEEGRAWAEAKIKAMTGGDRISARFMRQDFFQYNPTFKLTVIGNYKPIVRNVDDAMRRRINLIPFVRKPVNVNKNLKAELMEEAPGILQWMIDGSLDWQANGLARPPIVEAATEAYFADQDLFSQWIEECCDVRMGDLDFWDRSADLFDSWTKFCKALGEEPGTSKSFASKFGRKGFEPHRTMKARGYKFIRVKAGVGNPWSD